MDKKEDPRSIKVQVCQPNEKYRGGLFHDRERHQQLRTGPAPWGHKVEMSIPHSVCADKYYTER